jgi:hypothetical protein
MVNAWSRSEASHEIPSPTDSMLEVTQPPTRLPSQTLLGILEFTHQLTNTTEGPLSSPQYSPSRSRRSHIDDKSERCMRLHADLRLSQSAPDVRPCLSSSPFMSRVASASCITSASRKYSAASPYRWMRVGVKASVYVYLCVLDVWA